MKWYLETCFLSGSRYQWRWEAKYDSVTFHELPSFSASKEHAEHVLWVRHRAWHDPPQLRWLSSCGSRRSLLLSLDCSREVISREVCWFWNAGFRFRSAWNNVRAAWDPVKGALWGSRAAGLWPLRRHGRCPGGLTGAAVVRGTSAWLVLRALSLS